MSRVAEDRLERWEHETVRRKWDSAMQGAALRRSAAGNDSDDKVPDPIARAIDDRLALLERRTRQLQDRADFLESRWRRWHRGMLCLAMLALGLIAVPRPESLAPRPIRQGLTEESSGSTAAPSPQGPSSRGESSEG